jgi:hypothetical protein
MELSDMMVANGDLERAYCEEVGTYFTPLSGQSLLQHLPTGIKEKLQLLQWAS